MNPPMVMETEFSDPSLTAVDDGENRKLATKVYKEDPSVEAQIRKFENENKLPDVDRAVLARMSEERQYIHTEANVATTVGGVSTNYLYKFQRVHKAQINAREPQVSVRPKKRIGQIDPMVQKILDDFSATMQALITHYFSPDEMDLKAILNGAIQDVDTVGIAFLKLDWLEDMQRDPVGAWRPMDFQATLAQAKELLSRKANGEIKEGDAAFQDLKDTAATIKKQMEGELWRQVAFSGMGAVPQSEDPRTVRWENDGLPTEPQLVELPKYRGFVLRSIMPEDVRRDWSIFRPEEFRRSRHFTYCLKMMPEQIREFYDLGADTDLGPYTTTDYASADNLKNNDGKDPANRPEPEPESTNGELVVWVRMDRKANKIYHWIQGGCRYLREPETPEVSSSNWFNVWPVLFNRVTGRFLPISNTTLGRPLQEEINIVRTHKRAAKRRAYDAYIFEQGLFTDAEMERLRNRGPGSWTPTARRREELEKAIYRMPGQYDPMVHDVTEERQELGSVLNQSQASQGMTKGGADSATEAAIATQTGDAITNDDQGALESVIRGIGVAMGEILVQALPEENAKAIAGPGATWPVMNREQIWAHLIVEVEAGSTAMPNQQKRLDGLRTVVEIAQAGGIGTLPGGPRLAPVMLMKKAAEIMDWRDDPVSLVEFPMLPPMPALPGAPGAPGGAGPGGATVPSGGMPPGVVPPGQDIPQPPTAPPTQPTLPMVENQPTPPGMG